jgi:hypothetical protein
MNQIISIQLEVASICDLNTISVQDMLFRYKFQNKKHKKTAQLLILNVFSAFFVWLTYDLANLIFQD